MRLQPRSWLTAIVLVAAACGDNRGSPTDAARVDAYTDYDAPPTFGARMPQAIAIDPTNILASPKGMAISWEDDPYRAQEETFFDEYNASAWATQVGEYGVGALTTAPPGHIGSDAPKMTTESALLSMLGSHLTGSNADWGAPDPSTIYMFFIPVGTSVDDGTGSVTCQDYDGYHYDTIIGGVDIAYAIVGACHGEATALGISDLDDMMITAGHETLEAATDPRTAHTNNWGWAETDNAHAAFEYATEGELGDLCEYASTQDWVSPPSMDYSIQRTWSNAAARAGHDPCVGDASTPYYQTIPDDPDAGTINFEGTPQPTLGTKIALGSAGTLHLQVYSDSGAGPVTVHLRDWDGDYYGDSPSDALLTFTQPTGSYMPGDRIDVPVHVIAKSNYIDGAEAYEIDTTPTGSGGGSATSWWAFIVQ